MDEFHRVLQGVYLMLFFISRSHQSIIRDGTQEVHGIEKRSQRSPVPNDGARIEDSNVLSDSVYRGIESALYHKLKCLIDGKDFYNRGKITTVEWVLPSPSSTFKRRGHQDIYLVSESVSMHVDEGVYECKVTWADGAVLTRKISLCISPSSVVAKPPMSISTTGGRYAPVGIEVEFTCQAYVGAQKCGIGNHYDIVWSKFDENSTREPVGESGNVDVSQETIDGHSVGFGKIRILAVRQTDYGTYECNISNQYGSVTGNVTLTDKAPANKDRDLWILLGLLIFLSMTPCMIYGVRHCNAELTAFVYRWFIYDLPATAFFKKIIPKPVHCLPHEISRDEATRILQLTSQS